MKKKSFKEFIFENMNLEIKIKPELSNFLLKIVKQSNGYLKTERDASLFLYDIIKNNYINK